MVQSTDLTLSNQSGANYRTENNSITQALASNHKGASQPSYIITGMIWIDDSTSPWVCNVYDGTDDIEIGRIDPTSNIFLTQANLIDSNGNEILEHTATTSAVNHINITNAATGNGATIQTVGGDTNIDLTITTKGTGTLKFPKEVAFPDAGELTISSGAITVTGVNHTIDTQSDAASDDLDTINGGVDGQILIVRAENAARTVVIKGGTGNIETPHGGDIALDNTEKEVILKYDSATSDWHVLSEPQDNTVVALGDLGGGTDDLNLALGRTFTATVSTSTQTFTFSNSRSGSDAFDLYLTNGGSQTVNWPASVDWAGNTAPTLTASGVDHLVFATPDGGTTWYGYVAGLDMS